MSRDKTAAGAESTKNDRDGFVRIPPPLHARWLARCHREDGIDADSTAAICLQRFLDRDAPLLSSLEVTEEEE